MRGADERGLAAREVLAGESWRQGALTGRPSPQENGRESHDVDTAALFTGHDRSRRFSRDPINGPTHFALARYTPHGKLDTSFGRSGKVLTDFGARAPSCAFAVAVQRDGKVVAVGRSEAGGSMDFALARYTADGKLDGSFGRGGKVVTDLSSNSFDSVAVAIQANGKLVAIGASSTSGSRDFALARYNRDGTPDRSFGSDGRVRTDFGSASDDTPFAVAIQADGKVVVAGRSDTRGSMDFALARYTANGSLDASFGRGGKVLTNFHASSGDQAFALAIQANGKIVAAGWRYFPAGTDFALARYTADGKLDTSFGRSGKVVIDFVTR